MDKILISEYIKEKNYYGAYGFDFFYFKQKRAGLFNAGNQSLSAQVKFKTIAALVSTVILLVIFSGCAGVDGWMDTTMRPEEPVAIFECDAERAESDAVILLGIKDSSLIAGYRKLKTIGFFLKNTNIDPSTVHLPTETPSNFIHLVKVDNKYFDDFVEDFPQLTGMKIFAVYLKGLTVKQESFLRFKTLGDGDLRNMLPRQVEYIRKRRIRLMAVTLTMGNSARYQKQVGNTFQLVSP